MNRWLGTSICWLLRRHQWRRLHKREQLEQPNQGGSLSQYRLCDRCGATRIARARKAAA